MTYKELRERQYKEVNAFPFVFAFNDAQFEKAAAEKWGDRWKDPGSVIAIGAGGYVLKDDYPRMKEMFKRHRDELQEAIDADQTGHDFIEGMFYYELCNHEYSYTGDIEETLNALGLTAEDVNASEPLQAGLKAATKRAMQEG